MDGFQFYGGGRGGGGGGGGSAAAPPSNKRPKHGYSNKPQLSTQVSLQTRMQVVINSSPLKYPPSPVYDNDDDDDKDVDELYGSVSGDLMPRARGYAAAAGTMIPCGLLASTSSSASRPTSKLAYPPPPGGPVTSSSGPSIQQPKKRGRPPGWKQGMPYSTTSKRPISAAAKLAREDYLREHPEAAAGTRTKRPAAPKGPPKPRGRPPKKPPMTPRQILDSLERRYVPYICEWKGCKAELQNMDTLRRHVHKIHGSEEGWCRWSVCVDKTNAKPFRTKDDLVAHVEESHLVPFQWHMGFGYSNERPIPPGRERDEGASVPSYLLDGKGEQVTPWIREIKVESEVTRLARRGKLRNTLKWMNEEAPSEGGEEDDSADGSSR